jgi:mono/diheme cytochrome c family protein
MNRFLTRRMLPEMSPNKMLPKWTLWVSPLAAGLVTALLSGCDRQGKFAPVDMWNRSRLKPYEPMAFFPNGTSARPVVPGTVARGDLRIDDAMYAGRVNGQLVKTFPFPITQKVLARGQERFNIYCAPCHGPMGDGQGLIVKRGFTKPPDYHIARLKNAPVGHFYDVITNGYGAMYSYAARVQPRDRWAIAAYIRVLQNTPGGQPPPEMPHKKHGAGHGAGPAAGHGPAGSGHSAPGPKSGPAINTGTGPATATESGAPGHRPLVPPPTGPTGATATGTSAPSATATGAAPAAGH